MDTLSEEKMECYGIFWPPPLLYPEHITVQSKVASFIRRHYGLSINLNSIPLIFSTILTFQLMI